jgi:predicted alpha/beta hydrolase family esterase
LLSQPHRCLDTVFVLRYAPSTMRVIIVHGFNSNPSMNFYPWLRDSLRERGFEVVAPELPLVVEGDLDLPAVIEKMKAEVGYLKNDDILVGHSLGAFVILRYLEAVEMTETPRAVIMIAAPFNVSKPELRSLFIADLDADVLMWKAREFVVVHSRDDNMVPFEHGEKLASLLKARLVATQNDGHFLGERYPVLLETVEEISKRPFEFNPGANLSDDYSITAASR